MVPPSPLQKIISFIVLNSVLKMLSSPIIKERKSPDLHSPLQTFIRRTYIRGSQLSWRTKGSSEIYAQGPNEHHFLSFSYIFLCIPEVIKGPNYTGWWAGHKYMHKDQMNTTFLSFSYIILYISEVIKGQNYTDWWCWIWPLGLLLRTPDQYVRIYRRWLKNDDIKGRITVSGTCLVTWLNRISATMKTTAEAILCLTSPVHAKNGIDNKMNISDYHNDLWFWFWWFTA